MERSGKAVVLLVVAAAVLLMSVIVRVRWKRARERAEEVRRKAYWVAMEAQRLEAEAMREYQEAVWRESQEVERRGFEEEEEKVKVKGEVMREEEEDGRTIVYVMGACGVCGKETNTRCKRCKAVKYCSGKCQIFDWRNGHKEVCVPAIIDEDQSYEPNPNLNPKTAQVEEIQTPKITELPLQTEPKEDETANIAAVEKEKKDDKSILNPSISETTNKGKNHVPESNQSKETKSDETAKIKSGAKKINEDNSVLNPSNFEVTNKGKKAVMESRRVSSSRVTLIEEKVETTGQNIEIKSSENVSESSKTVLTSEEKTPKMSPLYMFFDLYDCGKTNMNFRPFGLTNIGNSCYANVVFQCLIFTQPLIGYLTLHKCSKKEWCLACEFQKLVLMGKKGVTADLSLENILGKLIDKSTIFGLGKQEDAHEFMRFVIDNMQSVCMKDTGSVNTYHYTEETTPVQIMFGGYLGSKIWCEKCQRISERTEKMLDLTVEIEGNITTLEEALTKFTSVEILDGDNKYNCSRCNSYERAKKKITILEAPNVLTIALKRFQPGQYGKISKPVRYPSHLNLSPYLSGTDASVSVVYALSAVVVHEDVGNEVQSGHYIAYVKDHKGKWYEVNDRKVKGVSLEKVLSKCAYMLLYTRSVPKAPVAIGRDRNVVRQIYEERRRNTARSIIPGGAGSDGSETSSFLSSSDEGSSSSSTSTSTTTETIWDFSTIDPADFNDPLPEYEYFFGGADRVSYELIYGPRIPQPGEPEPLYRVWA